MRSRIDPLCGRPWDEHKIDSDRSGRLHWVCPAVAPRPPVPPMSSAPKTPGG